MIEVVVALSAFVASFLSGLLGIGGGIVLAPLLLYVPPLFGLPPIPVKGVTGLTVVQAISASALGMRRHGAYGNVSTRLVLLMGPPAAIASLIAALLSGVVPDRLLLLIFAGFSFVGAVLLVLPVKAQQGDVRDLRVNAPLAVVMATIIGALGGLVGIGAIAFIVAALVYFLRVPARVAIGSSLGVGMFGAIAAFIGKAATAQIDPRLAVIVVGAALVGSPAGAFVSVRTRPAVLLRVLAGVVVVASIRIAWSALSP